MNNVIELLLTLQNLEMGPKPNSPENETEIRRLRQKIPPQIMGHYDRLRARDKKGVGLVRNGACAECHMRLASGVYAELLRREDVVLCDSCGRYLLPAKDEKPPAASSAPAPAPASTRPKTGRKARRKNPPNPPAA